MGNRFLYISEALSAPFDEGIKNLTYSLHKYLQLKADTCSVTIIENDIDDNKVLKLRLNKLFFNGKLRKLIKDFSPDVILYLPEASITFASLVRGKFLKLMNRSSRVVILATQHRNYSGFQRYIIERFLKPDLVLTLRKSFKEYFNEKGIKVYVLPPAVDNEKFCEASEEEKGNIRQEHGIPSDKTVVLHVGHIKLNRNIESLIDIQKQENVQVVIVGSTSIVIENDIKEKLIKEDIIVIDKAMSDISKIYKMSDIYVFPVINNREAIDMPLSVLEAMACNLPIVTTRFGGLIDYFEEDDSFKYFSDNAEMIDLVKRLVGHTAKNNVKMEQFTWNEFTDTVISACEEMR